MEAAGLGVGVIGLVSLFSACLDMLERWDAYKDLGFESGSMRARFIADRVRFRQWGQRVGIGQGQAGVDGHPALNNPSIRSAIDVILHSIKNIDDDAKRYASHLGKFSDSTSLLSESNTIIPNGHIHIDKLRSIPSRRDKLGWALRGKARALTLVGSFEILVQKLYDLVPPDSTTVEGQKAAEEGQSSATASIGGVNNWHDHVQKILLDLEKQIHNETRREIRDWLDAPDMRRTHDDFVLRRLTGTCDWILSRSEFHQWQSFAPGNPKILWINGPPGYGKTILCARLIEHMSANSQICVGYFFFSSEIESRANPFVVVRSWIAQLLTQAQEAFDMTREKWEATDGCTASEIDVKEIFNTLVQNLPPCIFVVDGLDECTATGNTVGLDHKRSLLEFLRFLTNAVSESKSRLLIVSRNDLRIREGLNPNESRTSRELVELQISPKDVEADANAFSQSIISRKLSNKSEAQQEALANRLGGKNLKQLQRTIDEAPNKLDHIYDRNWERIQHLENSSRRRALSILRWATFALRPLTVLEITECLLIPDGEDEEIDYEELPDSIDEIYVKTEILELCGSLIEIRVGPNSALDRSTIHLTHFSVKQYILSPNEKLRSSNEVIQNNLLAKYCLRYLTCDQTWKRAPSKMNNSSIIHAFRGYSVGLWYQHVGRGVSNSEEVFRLINAFFRPPNPKWELWRRNYIGFSINKTWALYNEIGKEMGHPLLYASLFELTETVDYLIHEVGLEADHAYSPNRQEQIRGYKWSPDGHLYTWHRITAIMGQYCCFSKKGLV
ncbi:prion-inhibition and propagation-domain-containing protein [Xylaria acuta]|nr:prion-inhibition and propagation-domain-containing protein [Xylaria acuta]